MRHRILSWVGLQVGIAVSTLIYLTFLGSQIIQLRHRVDALSSNQIELITAFSTPGYKMNIIIFPTPGPEQP
ncbi:hypothetical protein A3A70_01660 [candidate division WWE3 bacterium RIFCSPLOWO2_01_FULL_42_11]|uniref:Uncharacterized protein n=1 Tax=candidate division WWE3 bacterium RIFCSPLOWO2_01_FULL_42_11 TaxID=1802627 RepID=A0A1F4VR29_UNCKA|nr:MAG: hypothetical protein A3A70_01660 [candidate division WWE3 bacterium RIFCSPLOWO2_01_FULL_42_11]